MVGSGASDIKLERQKQDFLTTISPAFISGLVGILDCLIVVMVGVGVYAAYLGWSPESYQLYLAATTVNLVVTISVFYYSGLYDIEIITSPYRQFYKIVLICGVIFLLLVSLAFALKISVSFSRVWSFSSFILETGLIFLARIISYNILKKLAASGQLIRRLAVYGAGEQGRSYVHALTVAGHSGRRQCNFTT